MFGLFVTPFIDYFYRPVYYRPRYSVVDHYLLNFMRQLRAFDELELIERQQYQSKEDQQEKQQEENVRKENAQKYSKEEVEGKQNEQDKKEDNIPEETKKIQHQNPFRNIYYYEGKSRYDGHNYVEEHRERLTDSEGKVHVTQRRRLGDRWYENESITDEEGKTLTKESWHNVPEDQIENFKLEWGKHHNKNYAQLTSNTQQESSSDSTSNQKTDEKLNENQSTVENVQKTD